MIDIKGTHYDLIFSSNYIINGSDVCDGLTDVLNKYIELSFQTDNKLIEKTIYHELIHAFLYECGLSKYYDDEVLVDWFASQFKNIDEKAKEILRVFKGGKRGQK